MTWTVGWPSPNPGRCFDGDDYPPLHELYRVILAKRHKHEVHMVRKAFVENVINSRPMLTGLP